MGRRDSADASKPTAGEDARRGLPSVDRLLADTRVRGWVERWGHEPVREALRAALAAERSRLHEEASGEPADTEALLATARARIARAVRPSLRRALNGTGVVLHTNLGRAPLAAEARAALDLSLGYSNLEFDLASGSRGSRYDHCTKLLCRLTGAEAALVVNNNAAAVSLSVNELALDREVIVSRGELVEIGGSFRIPDVVRRSGAHLVEVGTTNRTRREDYANAVGARTGAILKVHPSNYRLEGFVSTVSPEQLVELGRDRGIPVIHDVGSGLLHRDLLPGFPEEPSVREAVATGVDLVTWSGDKLFGGPQAGLLLGSRETISRLRRNPLLRAFRVDKMTLCSLEATLLLYRDPEVAAAEIPVLRMLREPARSVRERARRCLRHLPESVSARVRVEAMESLVGGGSYPGHRIQSSGWVVGAAHPNAIERACREADPPLLGRVEDNGFRLDFRTLTAEEGREAAGILGAALLSSTDSASTGEASGA